MSVFEKDFSHIALSREAIPFCAIVLYLLLIAVKFLQLFVLLVKLICYIRPEGLPNARYSPRCGESAPQQYRNRGGIRLLAIFAAILSAFIELYIQDV
jgi:hypothetical protein